MIKMDTNTKLATTLRDQINTQTLHMVFLSIATLGIFLLMWLLRNHDSIQKTTRQTFYRKQNELWLAVCNAWILALPLLGGVIILMWGAYRADFILSMLCIVWYVLIVAYPALLIIWAFKAKKAI